MEAKPNRVVLSPTAWRGQLTSYGRAPIQRRCFGAPRPGGSGRILGETNLSTERAGAQAATRIPRADVECGRAQGAGAAPRQRAQTPLRLTAAVPIERLKRRSEFLRVASARRKCARPGLVLQANQAPDPEGRNGARIRIGFTVSKKVGHAVARNRARRRLRAAAAEVLPRRAAPGTDYVLIGRRGTLTRPYAQLIGDLEAALERLGAWRGEGAGGSRPGAGT